MKRIADMPRDELGRAPLTEKQLAVVDAIRRLSAERGYPPTVREIAAAIGQEGTNGVAQHLRLIERKGWITRAARCSRTVLVVGE